MYLDNAVFYISSIMDVGYTTICPIRHSHPATQLYCVMRMLGNYKYDDKSTVHNRHFSVVTYLYVYVPSASIMSSNYRQLLR